MGLNVVACFFAGVLIGAGVHSTRKWFSSKPALPAALWAFVAVPVALLWAVALSVFPAALFAYLPRGEFRESTVYSIGLALLSIILYWLICRRPFWHTSLAEPGASPNGGPVERFGNSGVGGGPPSVS
jgi:predicted permease